MGISLGSLYLYSFIGLVEVIGLMFQVRSSQSIPFFIVLCVCTRQFSYFHTILNPIISGGQLLFDASKESLMHHIIGGSL